MSRFSPPTPIVYFAHAEGCPACEALKPAIRAFAPALAARGIELRLADVTKGEKVPFDVTTIPAFALQVPGVPKVWVLEQKNVETVIDIPMLRQWIGRGLALLRGAR